MNSKLLVLLFIIESMQKEIMTVEIDAESFTEIETIIKGTHLLSQTNAQCEFRNDKCSRFA